MSLISLSWIQTEKTYQEVFPLFSLEQLKNKNNLQLLSCFQTGGYTAPSVPRPDWADVRSSASAGITNLS